MKVTRRVNMHAGGSHSAQRTWPASGTSRRPTCMSGLLRQTWGTRGASLPSRPVGASSCKSSRSLSASSSASCEGGHHFEETVVSTI